MLLTGQLPDFLVVQTLSIIFLALFPPLTHVRLGFDGQHQEVELGEAEDRGLVEGHPHKGGGQHLGVHLTPSPLEYRFCLELCRVHSDLEVVLQPVVHVTGGLP